MIEPIYQTLGLRIKKLRAEAGVPQTVVADALDLDRANVANIEAGKQRVMLHQLRPIAASLGTTVHVLLRKVL